MPRSQTRRSSRSSTTGKSPTRASSSPPKKYSPARSLDPYDIREVKVTITRLEMPKAVDNLNKDKEKEDSVGPSNGFTAQSSLRDLKARRSIRSTPNHTPYKFEGESTMSKLRNLNKTASPSVKSYSDKDLLTKKEKDKKFDSNEPQEWAGSFGAVFLMTAMPVCIILLQLACKDDHCGLENIRIPRLSEWRLFFDKDAFLYYAGYLCYLVIMTVLPIGKRVAGQQNKNGTLYYRMNGLYSLILAASMLAACVYQGYDVHEYLIKNSLKLTTTGLVYGLILSVVLYIKSAMEPVSKLNAYGSTSSSLFNFWQGREVNPRFGPIDVKQILFTSTVIGTDLINLSVAITILKDADSLEWSNLGNLNVAALAVITLQSIFFVDKMIFEDRFLSSFEITYEGMGYMSCVGYLLYPYISTLSARYLLIHRVELHSYLTVFWTIIFFLGYYLYRASNNQKDEFRRNPFSPAVSHLETIPTPAGKRLLVSGFWGIVRRPNYLGDILMHMAWAFLGFAPDIMPFVLTTFTTLLLIHRAKRDEARCEKRYRFAWKQYCERVKYIILPPVF